MKMCALMSLSSLLTSFTSQRQRIFEGLLALFCSKCRLPHTLQQLYQTVATLCAEIPSQTKELQEYCNKTYI